MEIEATFAIIAGVLMVAVVVVAGVSVLGGLTKVYVQNASPRNTTHRQDSPEYHAAMTKRAVR
jgi:hypothetical protein